VSSDTDRANPIAGTLEGVPGYPTALKVYRIPASRFWQVRCFFDGRIVKKSTKSEGKADAIKAAKDFYNSLLLKKSQNLPITQSATFERVALDLLKADEDLVKRGERAERFYTDEKQVFQSDIIPFFRKYHVRDITYGTLQNFIQHMNTRGKKPLSSSSISSYLTYVRKILRHAWKLGLIQQLPPFPEVKRSDNPREWFTSEQYDHLKKTINVLIKEKAVVRYHQITDELYQVVLFMVNTFLRPPDLKHLKNEHIEVVKTKTTQYLRIRPPGSKTVTSPVISMDGGVGVFEKLMAIHKKQDAAEPGDYVFFPALKNRQFAFETLRRQFNHVLDKAGLKKSATHAPRTLYSLRHTAIMFRLTKGDTVDLLTIARNCRTSVEMLERFYASHLTAEMNVDKLQSMKK
jgi:hypothetical protein